MPQSKPLSVLSTDCLLKQNKWKESDSVELRREVHLGNTANPRKHINPKSIGS